MKVPWEAYLLLSIIFIIGATGAEKAVCVKIITCRMNSKISFYSFKDSDNTRPPHRLRVNKQSDFELFQVGVG
jgi:hypothetical protein